MSYLRDYDDGMLSALEHAEASEVPLFDGGLMEWPARWADAMTIYKGECAAVKALYGGADD